MSDLFFWVAVSGYMARNRVFSRMVVTAVVGRVGGIFGLCVVSLISCLDIYCVLSACRRTGKCMDFVHEDLSLMSQEMDRWRALRKVKVSREDAPSTSF